MELDGSSISSIAVRTREIRELSKTTADTEAYATRNHFRYDMYVNNL